MRESLNQYGSYHNGHAASTAIRPARKRDIGMGFPGRSLAAPTAIRRARKIDIGTGFLDRPLDGEPRGTNRHLAAEKERHRDGLPGPAAKWRSTHALWPLPVLTLIPYLFLWGKFFVDILFSLTVYHLLLIFS